ncbi:Uncharacterised protein [uncultured archaeon]|nr:Uncharacterised protein [uncultured archaeon]
MKRKAIQLANQTLVISLPSKWVKEQGIKKGDEIDIEEKGKELIINSKSSDFQEIVELDISGLDPLINRAILGLYISGVDEIKLSFKNSALINKIQREIMNALIGFEIVKQEKNSCVIKCISKDSGMEFDSLLKRIFILIKSMGEEMIESLEKKEENFDHVVFTDYNINRFSNFCLRYLNKNGYENPKKTNSLYSIIQGLEHLGDIYKKIATNITANKASKEVSEIIKQLSLQVEDYFKLFYKFDYKTVIEMAKRYEELSNDIKKIKNSEISLLLNEFNRIIVIELLSNQVIIR